MATTPTLEQMRKAVTKGGKAKIHEESGLPIDAKGMIRLFHHTSPEAAELIRKTGLLRSAGEPHVYATTHDKPDTGYGSAVVPIRVHHARVSLDDEFPSGRKDFSINVGKPGGQLAVGIDDTVNKADGGAVDIATVGINEAPDMGIKEAVMPAATTQNAMPTGGVDFQPQMPGTQFAPATPAPQPGQAPGAPGQPAMPQVGQSVGMPGQNMPTMPGAEATSEVAPNAPPSNMLSRTPQGNMLQAMKPMARMAKGGKVKGVIKEKVKVSPTGDAMMYELTRAQRYTKKVK